jgi:hypothetical protein
MARQQRVSEEDMTCGFEWMRLDGNNHACGIKNRNRFRCFQLCFRLDVANLVGNIETWSETQTKLTAATGDKNPF